jgi:glyoxylase-like metal-dependent hydrolase (beta-lactamase superfamily II)
MGSYWSVVSTSANDDRLPEGIERVRAGNAGPFTLTGTNTYLLGRPAWVIDPGPLADGHADRVLAAAEERGGVSGIALTHRHLDHSEAAMVLRERTGASLAVAPPPEGGSRFEEPSVDGLEPDVLLRGGDRFGPLEAIETPGHAPDHLCLLAGTVLFCGDTVMGEGSVFVAPGGNSLVRYLDSLRKLQRLDLVALCPGHGPVVWDPHERLAAYVEHRLDRERRLLDALGRGLRSRDELLDDVWDDAPAALRAAAALTLEAHLEKLEGEGRLPGGVERLG